MEDKIRTTFNKKKAEKLTKKQEWKKQRDQRKMGKKRNLQARWEVKNNRSTRMNRNEEK